MKRQGIGGGGEPEAQEWYPRGQEVKKGKFGQISQVIWGRVAQLLGVELVQHKERVMPARKTL